MGEAGLKLLLIAALKQVFVVKNTTYTRLSGAKLLATALGNPFFIALARHRA